MFFDRKPASEKPWTEKLWIFDLRTNQHFTLKEKTLKRPDLDEFVHSFHPENRHERKRVTSVQHQSFSPVNSLVQFLDSLSKIRPLQRHGCFLGKLPVLADSLRPNRSEHPVGP